MSENQSIFNVNRSLIRGTIDLNSHFDGQILRIFGRIGAPRVGTQTTLQDGPLEVWATGLQDQMQGRTGTASTLTKNGYSVFVTAEFSWSIDSKFMVMSKSLRATN